MGDQAFAICGCSPGSSSTACRLYDLSENSWTNKTSMTYARKDTPAHGAGCYEDAVVAGYNETTVESKTEKYDVAGDSWSTKSDYLKATNVEASRPHVSTCVYFAATIYDLVNDVWLGLGFGRNGGADAGFRIGSVIYQNNRYSDTNKGSYGFDTDDKSFFKIADSIQNAPSAGAGCSDEAGAGYGFVWGGRPEGGTGTWSTTWNQRYEQAGDVWTSRTAMGSNSMRQGTFAIDGCGHSVAGQEESYPYNALNYNGRYDNAANSWITKTAHPTGGGGVCGFFQPDNFPPSAPTSLSVSET